MESGSRFTSSMIRERAMIMITRTKLILALALFVAALSLELTSVIARADDVLPAVPAGTQVVPCEKVRNACRDAKKRGKVCFDAIRAGQVPGVTKDDLKGCEEVKVLRPRAPEAEKEK